MVRVYADNTAQKLRWIDVVDPTREELMALGQEYNIHSTSIQDCLEPEHLPKYEAFEHVTFLILRVADPAAPPEADNLWSMTRKLAVFYSEGFILTVHRSEMAFLQPLRARWAQPPKDEKFAWFHILAEIMKCCVQTYEKPLAELSSRIEGLESRLFEGHRARKAGPLLVYELHDLKRRLSVIEQMLDFTIATVSNVKPVNLKHAPLVQDTRESAERLYHRARSLMETSNNLISLNLTLSTYRTGEVMRVLTILSVFFMPLTFIAGVYGMNFRFMPELDKPWGYPAALLLMAGVTFFILRWFKRNGWL